MNISSFHMVRDVRPRMLLSGVEVALVVLLAIQSARLVWIVADPGLAAPTTAVANADYSILTRFDPFFREGPEGAAAPIDATQGFRLFGVRADGTGRGSAIIAGPDGRQVSIAVGEDVGRGVKLAQVGADHVVLDRGGVRSRLYFPNAVREEVNP